LFRILTKRIFAFIIQHTVFIVYHYTWLSGILLFSTVILKLSMSTLHSDISYNGIWKHLSHSFICPTLRWFIFLFSLVIENADVWWLENVFNWDPFVFIHLQTWTYEC
jgi:hypothetical protein